MTNSTDNLVFFMLGLPDKTESSAMMYALQSIIETALVQKYELYSKNTTRLTLCCSHNLNFFPSQLLDNIPNATMVMLLVGIRMAATTGDNRPCTA